MALLIQPVTVIKIVSRWRMSNFPLWGIERMVHTYYTKHIFLTLPLGVNGFWIIPITMHSFFSLELLPTKEEIVPLKKKKNLWQCAQRISHSNWDTVSRKRCWCGILNVIFTVLSNTNRKSIHLQISKLGFWKSRQNTTEALFCMMITYLIME